MRVAGIVVVCVAVVVPVAGIVVVPVAVVVAVAGIVAVVVAVGRGLCVARCVEVREHTSLGRGVLVGVALAVRGGAGEDQRALRLVSGGVGVRMLPREPPVQQG